VAVSAWTGEGIETVREVIAASIDDDPEIRLRLEPSQGRRWRGCTRTAG